MTAPRYRRWTRMLTVIRCIPPIVREGCDTGPADRNSGPRARGPLVERSAVPPETATRRSGLRAEYAAFIKAMVKREPKTFAIVVAGAFVYALCTVASSIVIRWVIDHVIVPRFEDGDVEVATVVTGCTLIIGVGVLRAIGVVVRRSFAGITQWRIAQGLGDDVVDQLVRQPASWHHRQSDGQLVARAGVDIDTTVGVMAPIPFATERAAADRRLSGVAAAHRHRARSGCRVGVPGLDVAQRRLPEARRPLLRRRPTGARRLLGVMHESFEGVQLVKAYGAEERETERLSAMAGSIRDSRIHAVYLRGTFESLLEVIPSITNIGIVILGASRRLSG